MNSLEVFDDSCEGDSFCNARGQRTSLTLAFITKFGTVTDEGNFLGSHIEPRKNIPRTANF